MNQQPTLAPDELLLIRDFQRLSAGEKEFALCFMKKYSEGSPAPQRPLLRLIEANPANHH
jgi:hypothetical protein